MRRTVSSQSVTEQRVYRASETDGRTCLSVCPIGGVPLQTAYEELKLLKPRYKAMRDEMEKSKRAASGSAAGGRSSAASQLSARRLERQREREALRKQPKPWQ